ncbi:D-alanine--D-alanine ligase [bacterium]|nr:D-alanine--D-alanine ligase [bacterium]
MKKKIALVFGGRSAEHEVSIVSASNIYAALDKTLFDPVLVGISKEGSWYYFSDAEVFKKYKSISDTEMMGQNLVSLLTFHEKTYLMVIKTQEKIALDCAFPIVHGTMGEDGTLQGFFKILNLPFVGCGVLSSAVGMDKDYMKRILTDAKIPNSKFIILKKDEDYVYADLVKKIGTPFFIKPANAGSSVGVHKIKNEMDFTQKLNDSFLYDHKVVAEEFIEGREIECSVMGHGYHPKASLPGELIVKHEFYSYEAKYVDPDGAVIQIPARISADETANIQAMAIKTYKALGCDGMTRVDFFLKKDGSVFVNEINTLPGFTQISMYPKMWQATGIQYKDLITALINLAFETHITDNQLKLSF